MFSALLVLMGPQVNHRLYWTRKWPKKSQHIRTLVLVRVLQIKIIYQHWSISYSTPDRDPILFTFWLWLPRKHPPGLAVSMFISIPRECGASAEQSDRWDELAEKWASLPEYMWAKTIQPAARSSLYIMYFFLKKIYF